MKDFMIGVGIGLAYILLGAGLMLLVVGKACAAELFVEGGVGTTVFQKTTPDGVWWQQPFPHSFDLHTMAFKAGLGLQLNEHWSVTGSYVNLGTIKAFTEAVSDENYDHGDRKDKRVRLTAYDNYQGGQVMVAYRWTQWPVQPFLSGGVAVMSHHVRAYHSLSGNTPTEYAGVLPMAVVGGGLCWQWVCGEVNYYRGIMAPQYPISTSVIVPMLTLKYPF